MLTGLYLSGITPVSAVVSLYRCRIKDWEDTSPSHLLLQLAAVHLSFFTHLTVVLCRSNATEAHLLFLLSLPLIASAFYLRCERPSLFASRPAANKGGFALITYQNITFRLITATSHSFPCPTAPTPLLARPAPAHTERGPPSGRPIQYIESRTSQITLITGQPSPLSTSPCLLYTRSTSRLFFA